MITNGSPQIYDPKKIAKPRDILSLPQSSNPSVHQNGKKERVAPMPEFGDELKYLIESAIDSNREMAAQFKLGNQEMAHLRSEVIRLSDSLEPLMHTILGNGGPGILTRLALVEQESKLRDERQDEKIIELGLRQDKTDSKRWQMLTIAITSGVAIVVAILHWLLKA
jgi:hypothetical protein